MSKCEVYIIAEAGVNHNGSLEFAKQLVDIAANAGANAVKFQTFKAANLVTKAAAKARYQIANEGVEGSQFEMLQRLELSEADHYKLITHCKSRKIEFLSTPFDLESLTLLTQEFDLPILKISSGDITNAPLLLQAARSGRKIILSSGMCLLSDIEAALSILALGYVKHQVHAPTLSDFQAAYYSDEGQRALQEHVSLLHCTTEYPTPMEDVNLRVMDTLSAAFGLPVGYSDHTMGIEVAIAAVARGAKIIEKHITLDRTLPGPDHKASIEPGELMLMVSGIRNIEMALGSAIKRPVPTERQNMAVARKSLRAAGPIEVGSAFDEANLCVKRPGDGVSPLRYWEYLGKIATKTYEPDSAIE